MKTLKGLFVSFLFLFLSCEVEKVSFPENFQYLNRKLNSLTSGKDFAISDNLDFNQMYYLCPIPEGRKDISNLTSLKDIFFNGKFIAALMFFNPKDSSDFFLDLIYTAPYIDQKYINTVSDYCREAMKTPQKLSCNLKNIHETNITIETDFRETANGVEGTLDISKPIHAKYYTKINMFTDEIYIKIKTNKESIEYAFILNNVARGISVKTTEDSSFACSFYSSFTENSRTVSARIYNLKTTKVSVFSSDLEFSKDCTWEPKEGNIRINNDQEITPDQECDGRVRNNYIPLSFIRNLLINTKIELEKDFKSKLYEFSENLAKQNGLSTNHFKVVNAISQIDQAFQWGQSFIYTITATTSPAPALKPKQISNLISIIIDTNFIYPLSKADNIFSELDLSKELVYLDNISVFSQQISGVFDAADTRFFSAFLKISIALTNLLLSYNLDIDPTIFSEMQKYLSSITTQNWMSTSRAVVELLKSNGNFLKKSSQERMNIFYQYFDEFLSSLTEGITLASGGANHISGKEKNCVFIVINSKKICITQNWDNYLFFQILDKVKKSVKETEFIGSYDLAFAFGKFIPVITSLLPMKIPNKIFNIAGIKADIFKINFKAIIEANLRDILPVWTSEFGMFKDNFIIEWECGADFQNLDNVTDDLMCKTIEIQDRPHFLNKLSVGVERIAGVETKKNKISVNNPPDHITSPGPYILFQDPSLSNGLIINTRYIWANTNPCGSSLGEKIPNGFSGICELNALLNYIIINY